VKAVRVLGNWYLQQPNASTLPAQKPGCERRIIRPVGLLSSSLWVVPML
jgi:hypothetical protein